MIVLPMAGRSSRFYKAGYLVPKYQLPITTEKTVFDCVLLGFERYFDNETFLIICLADDVEFVSSVVEEIGIKKFHVFSLNETTRGQAETVYLGLKGANVADDESILIFNIDTFRPDYKFPPFSSDCDGYLEVFRGSGDNWSYAKLGNDDYVVETTEKIQISDLCSTGGYYFRLASDFSIAYEKNLKNKNKVNQEYYVAPLYNDLIAQGLKIRVDIIPRECVIFCGVPTEYEALDKKDLLSRLGLNL